MSDIISPQDTASFGHWFYLLTLVDKNVPQDYLSRYSQHMTGYTSDHPCRSSSEKPSHV